MNDLFTRTDPLRDGYTRIYDALSELREGFHRSGRLDDSNAKLDEVSKLFATHPPSEERIARLMEMAGGIPHRHEQQTEGRAYAGLNLEAAEQAA